MNEELSRRGFFAGLGRWGALLALGGVVVKLLSRSRGTSDVPAAGGNETCARCGLLNSCSYPGGVRTREAADVAKTDPDGLASANGRGLCGAPPSWTLSRSRRG